MTDRRGVEAALSVRSKRLLEIWLGGEERLRLVREAREICEERRNVIWGSAAALGKNSANSASEDNSSSSGCDTSGTDTDDEEEAGLAVLTSQVLVLAKVRSLKHHRRTRVNSVGLGDRRGCDECKKCLKVNNGLLYRTVSLKLEGGRIIY
jgi:hypothetical protein